MEQFLGQQYRRSIHCQWERKFDIVIGLYIWIMYRQYACLIWKDHSSFCLWTELSARMIMITWQV